MFAHASRRGAGYLRTASRPLHIQSTQLRPFHYPRGSPLLANSDPRNRHLLPALARASATFALQTRGLQASALPQNILKGVQSSRRWRGHRHCWFRICKLQSTRCFQRI